MPFTNLLTKWESRKIVDKFLTKMKKRGNAIYKFFDKNEKERKCHLQIC